MFAEQIPIAFNQIRIALRIGSQDDFGHINPLNTTTFG